MVVQKNAPSPVVTFLSRLRQTLKDHVPEDAFNAAVRNARSHAGGVERARRQAEARQQELDQFRREDEEAKEEEESNSDSDSGDKSKSSDKSKSKDSESGKGGFEVSVKAASELDAQLQEFAMWEETSYGGRPRLPKTDERIQYTRSAPSATNSCGNCTFFMHGNRCCIVEGVIAPDAACNMANPMAVASHEGGPGMKCPDCGKEHDDDGHPDPDMKSMSDGHRANFEPNLKLFFELQEFAEVPEWIPFLPTPGEYRHPKWGTVKMTADRAKRMMKNFSDKVYQGHIPIDLEHSLKVSGAAGYVSNLRQNSDGSVDAKIDWTDLGRDAITKDRFKYFSPEWWDKWSHPTNGQQFNDVIVGGALTTRPFFKDSSFGGLRPLIASEGDLFVFSDSLESLEDLRFEDALETFSEEPQAFQSKRHSEGDDEMGMTEEESKQFSELETRVQASEAARETLAGELKSANDTIAAMVLREKTQRYTELAKDWSGEKDTNVKTLLSMSEAFGEDSDTFKNFVTSMTTAATATAEAKRALFRDVGSSRTSPNGFTEPGSDNGLDPEIDSRVKTYREQNPGVSVEVAQAMVFSESPELYERWEAARERRVKQIQSGV